MKEQIIIETEFTASHFTTTKSCGNMKDDSLRNTLLSSLGLDGKNIVFARQTHGVKVVSVSEKDKGCFVEDCDGLITDEKNIALGIFTADCMPVLMFSADRRVKAAVHAGWKGLAGGILQNALRAFKELYCVSCGDISVYIAPHIKQCCYDVNAELADIFKVKLNNNKLDLSAVARGILTKEGVKNISISAHCSFHEDDLFFSYRKNKTESRMITVVAG
jgi:uncharacterized protein, YfiH family